MKRLDSRQVVILAGGLGTRLRPITETVPKPMVPVLGRPFLEWQLLDIKRQGLTEVVLLVSYLGEQIETHFGDGEKFGLSIQYSYEAEPLGTGGALKNARAKLHDRFLLINGDSYLEGPLARMLEVANDFDAVISVYDNRDPVPVIPNLKVADGLVIAYEKDADPARGYDLIDSGIYVLRRDLLDEVSQARFALADLWPPLITRARLGAFHIPTRFYDIGTLERLREFEVYLQEKK